MHIVGWSSNCSLWRCVTACLEEFSSMVCPNGSLHGRKFPLECDGLGESMMQLFFFKDETACYPWNHVYGFFHESYGNVISRVQPSWNPPMHTTLEKSTMRHVGKTPRRCSPLSVLLVCPCHGDFLWCIFVEWP